MSTEPSGAERTHPILRETAPAAGPSTTGTSIDKLADPANGVPTVIVLNRFPPRDVARAGLVLILVGLGVYFFWALREVLFLMFLALLVATAIEPLVNRLRRGPFTKGSGTLVVYVAIVLVIALPLYFTAPALAAQMSGFTDNLPERLSTLRPYAESVPMRPVRESILGALESAGAIFQSSAPAEPDKAIENAASAAHTVFNGLTVFVLAFYWILERTAIKRIVLHGVGPKWAASTNAAWIEIEEKLGGWVRGQLLLMASMAVMAGIGYLVIGLPSPLLLAVIAGLAEIVPIVGPFIAFAPAVLVALTISPTTALIVIAYALVIQQFESYVLVPRIMGHSIGVSPLTVMLGILVGSTLYGLPGAFLAVPLAGAVQVVLAHLLREEDGEQARAHVTATLEAPEEERSPEPTRDGIAA